VTCPAGIVQNWVPDLHSPVMSNPRDELRELVEHLPDEQVPAVLSELRARLAAAPPGGAWPPAWFAIAEGSATDVSERVEEILAEGLGRRPA